MKKFLSLFLSVLLAMAFCTVANAATSPVGEKKHNVTVTASNSDKTVTGTVTDGENYTLNATAVDGYKFVKWTISGSYDIVSGSLTSQKLVITPKSDIIANAEYQKNKFKVTITQVDENDTDNVGEEEITYVGDGNTIKLDAKVDGNYGFIRWEIDGKYEIVSGSLDSANLVIRPLGDISINKVVKETDIPEDDVLYNVVINRNNGDTEYVSVVDGDKYTLTASKPTKGYAFAKWEISGKYEIVSGSLTSEKIVIKPLGDVTVKEVFTKVVQGAVNNSDKSPQTGNNLPIVLFAIFLCSATVSVISRKTAK